MSTLGNKEVMAENLKFYLSRSGKTQKELSELLGISPSAFNDWIKAKKYPRIDKLEMLANIFGIQKSDLIEKRNPETEKKPVNDELSGSVQKLIEFARTVPEDKADMILRVMRSIVEADE